MPRPSKSKTTAPVVDASVVETPLVDAAVVDASAVKAKKTKKVATAATDATPATATAAAAAADVDTIVCDAVVSDVAIPDSDDILVQSTEFLAKLNQLGALLASVKADYRSLEKKWSREMKAAQKSSAKRKRKTGNRQPSGFVKPTKISDELADFLEKDRGTEMARTDVTREINKYIRSNSLQDKDNGRKIIPDSKLQSLLKLKITDELTYFNLQRYMSPHFYKADKTLLTTA